MSTARSASRRMKKRSLRLPYTVNAEASEQFLALPMNERERRIAEFREACAPAFASVDEYLAEKRRETARDNEA